MQWTLDHIVAVVDDLDAARADAERVFGRGPDWVSGDWNSGDRVDDGGARSQGGLVTCEWRAPGGALELLRPAGGAPREACGPRSLVLGTADLESARARLGTRGLDPSPIAAADGVDARTGARRAWRRFRCPDAHLGGLKLFVLEREEPPAETARPDLEAVEIATGDPRALADLLGAQIGLERVGEGELRVGPTRVLLRRDPIGGQHRIAALHVGGQRSVPGG
ncbi:MAG: hypothetical protein AAFU73_15845 [Planctomycetota bacterium]